MKAIVIVRPGGPEVLQLQEIEDPKPKAEEILVTVHATGLNRGELLQRKGLYPPPPGVREDIPGLEFAGVIEKTGERVMGILPGGGYAEKIVTRKEMTLPIPKNFSFEEAAAIPEVFLTAYDALFNHLELKNGETLLIHAIGSSVGLAALQLAKNMGIKVFGTAGSDEKIAKAKKLGLDKGINYKTENFAEAFKEVDAILDLVGASYFEKNIQCLNLKGRMVVVGLVGGSDAKINLGALMRKRLKIIGTVLRSRSVAEKIALTQDFKKKILPLFESGAIRPVIDRAYPMEEVAQAHAYMEANKNFGKIIVNIKK